MVARSGTGSVRRPAAVSYRRTGPRSGPARAQVGPWHTAPCRVPVRPKEPHTRP